MCSTILPTYVEKGYIKQTVDSVWISNHQLQKLCTNYSVLTELSMPVTDITTQIHLCKQV